MEAINKKNEQIKETNRDRFIRIVERRVNLILDNLESLGKCSNGKIYEYNEQDVNKIFGEIEKKTKEIKSLFSGKVSRKKTFRLEK